MGEGDVVFEDLCEVVFYFCCGCVDGNGVGYICCIVKILIVGVY